MLPIENKAFELPKKGVIAIYRAHGSYNTLPKDRLICFQGFFPTHETLASAGYLTTTTPPETTALAIVHITRSKDETRDLVAKAYDSLPLDGNLLIDGAKTLASKVY